MEQFVSNVEKIYTSFYENDENKSAHSYSNTILSLLMPYCFSSPPHLYPHAESMFILLSIRWKKKKSQTQDEDIVLLFLD